jgi:hypothetical protein
VDVDHAGAEPARDLLGSISAAVVRDDDFAVDVVLAKRPLRLVDADRESVGLVQARHHDGNLDGRLPLARVH